MHLDHDTAINRASLWKGSQQFLFNHIPVGIARKCVNVNAWELELIFNSNVIPQCLLHQINDQIQNLTHCSNQAPR
jgi:hypothetical protein